MKVEDRIKIQHAVDAIDKAKAFTCEISQTEYLGDEKLQLALVRLLEIVGEAASGVSDDLKKSATSIPWKKMIAMRNRLIHGYFDVDYNIVWDTIKKDLPPLAKQLKMLLCLQA